MCRLCVYNTNKCMHVPALSQSIYLHTPPNTQHHAQSLSIWVYPASEPGAPVTSPFCATAPYRNHGRPHAFNGAGADGDWHHHPHHGHENESLWYVYYIDSVHFVRSSHSADSTRSTHNLPTL